MEQKILLNDYSKEQKVHRRNDKIFRLIWCDKYLSDDCIPGKQNMSQECSKIKQHYQGDNMKETSI